MTESINRRILIIARPIILMGLETGALGSLPQFSYAIESSGPRTWKLLCGPSTVVSFVYILTEREETEFGKSLVYKANNVGA